MFTDFVISLFRFCFYKIPDLEIMEPSPDSSETSIPVVNVQYFDQPNSEFHIPQVSKSKPAVVESGGGVSSQGGGVSSQGGGLSSQVGGVSSQVGGVSSSQKPRAAQVLPTSAQDSSPGSEVVIFYFDCFVLQDPSPSRSSRAGWRS